MRVYLCMYDMYRAELINYTNLSMQGVAMKLVHKPCEKQNKTPEDYVQPCVEISISVNQNAIIKATSAFKSIA